MNTRNRIVILLVLLSMVPVAFFIRDAEGNFKKAQIKNIAAKRRERLDQEHGVDRAAMEKDFEKLD